MTDIASRRLMKSKGASYAEVLEGDSFPDRIPASLRIDLQAFQGDHDIPIDRYLTREWHDIEKEKIWRRVWQMACREEHVPTVGDTYVYDITDISILVVHAADRIRAFYNACPHQGRQLADFACNVGESLRCPYHGFTFDLGGSLVHMPGRWDYPHISFDEFSLREVQCDAWGGFVFINMDPNAPSLRDFLGDIDVHFDKYPLEDRFLAAHVEKVIRCNWKVAQEAFMEGGHTYATHPQLLPSAAEENAQYDPFENYSRAVGLLGMASPNLDWSPSENEIAALSFSAADVRDEPELTIPEGETFRSFRAKQGRDALRQIIGAKADELSDAEIMDTFYFTVFPNFHPWSSYSQLTYRFRPYRNDPEMCIMESFILSPFSGDRPPAAKVHRLGPDDSYLDAPELGLLARVFDQDEFNMPMVQRGMHSLREWKEGLTLSVYQHTKVRHFHNLYDEYVAEAT